MPKCRYCKQKFEGFNSLDRFCSVEHAMAYLATPEGVEKHKKARAKLAREAAKAQRASKPKKPTDHEKLTQEAFNKMIRLLDAGESCISCGRSKCGTYWDAGHFKSVGGHVELRYDPRNCYLQGSGCNRANRRPDKNSVRGVETIAQEYEVRLREKMGDELVDWLNGPHEIPHFKDHELKQLRAVFAAESRRLERGESPSRDWRSLGYKLRDLIEG